MIPFRRVRRPTTLLLIAGSAALGSGCSSGSSTDTDSTPLNAALVESVENTILPAVISFRAAAAALDDQAQSFCASSTSPAVGTLQAAWRTLSERWSQLVLYNLGPLNNDPITPRVLFIESMRLRGTNYTQTVREEQNAAFANSVPLDAAYFAGLPFTKQGLLALEVLLFEDHRGPRSSAPEDILEAYVSVPRRCPYLRGMASHVLSQAMTVEDGWQTDFANKGVSFKDMLLQGNLEDGAQPVPAVFSAIADHFNYVKTRKLEGTRDAQLSGHFFPNIEATLNALGAFLRPSDSNAPGFLDLMAERGFGAEVAQIESNLAAAITAVQAEAQLPLTTVFGQLEGALKGEIPLGLGINLGIDFSDGD